MTESPNDGAVMVTAADGMRIAVRHLPGAGNPIVALHGFTGDSSTLAPLIEECRGTRPALLVDMIGHGKSDAPAHLEHYSMTSVVDQVLSVIGQHPPQTVHLVGYSMGARVALSLAARAPWYFASLTLLSGTGGLEDPSERSMRHIADLALADRIEEIGVEAFIDEWLTLDLFQPYIQGLTEEEHHNTRSQRVGASSLGLANSLRGTGTGAMAPLWSAVRSIRSPLLAIAGSLDTKFVALAQQLADSATFGQSKVIEGVGHVVHVENLPEVASIVEQYLSECEQDEDSASELEAN